jgi:hypothetical protein
MRKANALLMAASGALFLATAGASILEHGVGIVYGDNHAFSLQAPKGWVLDNESAVPQGIHAVFYPKNSSWKESKVVAYAQARPRTDEVATADDAAKAVVADFHKNGSANYRGKRIKTLKTDHGKEAVIYHFSGDEWGNSEAAAYFVEEKTINFVVLNSRNPKLFAASLEAFDQIVKSYLFLGEQLPEKIKLETTSPARFEDLYSRAQAAGKTEEGKQYEHGLNSEVSDVFGKPLHAALVECEKGGKPPYKIKIVLIIAADGETRIVGAPDESLSVCVAAKLHALKLPVPPQPDWLVAISMTIAE